MNFRKILMGSLTLIAFLATLAGCSSGAMKARKAERDKFASQGKIYCDFVNGELFPDIEVELNLEMVKRCDQDKAMTITGYKTPSENVGVMYCCVSQGDKRNSENRSEERPKKDDGFKAPPVTASPAAPPPVKAAPAAPAKDKEVEGSN